MKAVLMVVGVVIIYIAKHAMDRHVYNAAVRERLNRYV